MADKQAHETETELTFEQKLQSANRV
ncbi:hypothetical protein CGLO_13813 [Colletotrichum gloeosporioides Cg-14]|uniref:Uncharacterized protein n=1 Tax=Colletotrichum gloeosporioides (strain Cg-14) TaxID=1237896 RepID=T0L689_COLGC|nr:hypothetical protein CGLO_13813 [Colletotrichum gloeosporioides Cg-14]